jgi:hypothetical protein
VVVPKLCDLFRNRTKIPRHRLHASPNAGFKNKVATMPTESSRIVSH